MKRYFLVSLALVLTSLAPYSHAFFSSDFSDLLDDYVGFLANRYEAFLDASIQDNSSGQFTVYTVKVPVRFSRDTLLPHERGYEGPADPSTEEKRAASRKNDGDYDSKTARELVQNALSASFKARAYKEEINKRSINRLLGKQELERDFCSDRLLELMLDEGVDQVIFR